MTKIKAKIQLRRDTSANFTSVNPTLLLGEFAFETDTMTVTEGGSVSVKLKIGDGVNPWTELPYTTFGFQAVAWEDITGKPTEFAPAPHTHEIADVIGLEATLEAIAESIPAAQIQSDWNQTNNAALDFIKNKPSIPAAGLPAGGTAGQILTKIDATDYNANWQENFADWTSQVKHTVKNNGLSGTITKGTAVYVTGSNGTNMLVGRASNASEATSSKTMGLMQSDITTTGGNQTGFVITEGLLGGLNTAGQTAGDPVWLGVNGALIYGLANKPYAPAHLVFIGIVTKVSAGSGEIFVKVQNGFELKEIHDVDLISTAPINGHVLGFNGTLWVNKTIAGWLGFTPEPAIAAGTTSQYWRGDKTWQTLDKIAVGLGNVDNTSDLNKPISTATQTALNSKFTLPTLTAGSILFSDGTTIAQDNANLFWDNVNKRLGIGTATPNSRINALDGTVSELRFNSGAATLTPSLAVGNTSASGKYAALVAGTGGSAFIFDSAGYFDIAPEAKSSYTSNTLGTSAVSRLRVMANGNTLIGTTTDAGFKLDVNGTARVSGNFNPTANINLHSTGTSIKTIDAYWGGDPVYGLNIQGNASSITTSNGIANGYIVRIGSGFSVGVTANTEYDNVRIATTNFNPTSGTSRYNILSITGAINQTGGANGITRGLYINPTLTSAADFRAIEVASGITILGAATTAKASLRIPSGTAPTSPVNGDIWFDGTDIKMRIGGVTKTFTLI
jgi:hypothetical protein